MIKILKKSDWGDYWISDSNLNDDELKTRSFSMLSKLGISVSNCDKDTQFKMLSKEIYNNLINIKKITN